MATTQQDGGEAALPAHRAVLQFLAAWQQSWHAGFPGLHRRAQPQIIDHLGSRGRDGAAVGELHGLVKQIFLLDDSTVKERILEISRLGLCRLEPAEETLSTRTVVIPTADLLDRFDRYLLALGMQVQAAAAAIDPTLRPLPLPTLSAAQRWLILRAPATYTEPWRAALEQIFDARALSRARRVEAMRHLNATSHWTLLHMAIAHRYGVGAVAADADSILADAMAAALLTLTGQNFQTTRDHIGYLMDVGLLACQPGKALRVALAAPAVAPFDAALAAAAAALPILARRLIEATETASEPLRTLEPEALRTLEPEALRTMRRGLTAPALRHELAVVTPGAAPLLMPIAAAALTIGRLPPADLVLPGADVSRQHCRLELTGRQLRITDLNSTNGTLVDGRRITQTTRLHPGAKVQIGASVLTYQCHPLAPPAADAADAAAAAGHTLRRAGGRNKAGNSA